MAIGIWKKIKNGLGKVWNGIKKGAKWVNDKVFKPVVKPALDFVSPYLGPAGKVAKGAAEALSDGIDGDWGKAKKQVSDWGQTRLQPMLRD